MRVRSMSVDRFVDLSVRLLAGAAVLTAVGLALSIRFGWRQSGSSFGEDGTATDVGLPFGQHVFLLVAFDLSSRQIGVQLLLASALVAAAVVALHRNPSRSQVRSLRWEVLGSGGVVLVPVVGLAVAFLYVLTDPGDANGDVANFIGPMKLTEMVIANLITLGASLLVLTAATLWWLRLDADPAVPVVPEEAEDVEMEEVVEQEAADSHQARTNPHRESSGSPDDAAAGDYRHDWSPEDFRPPR